MRIRGRRNRLRQQRQSMLILLGWQAVNGGGAFHPQYGYLYRVSWTQGGCSVAHESLHKNPTVPSDFVDWDRLQTNEVYRIFTFVTREGWL